MVHGLSATIERASCILAGAKWVFVQSLRLLPSDSLAFWQREIWVWVKIKPPADNRFWSMLPLTRVPFRVHIFDPRPVTRRTSSDRVCAGARHVLHLLLGLHLTSFRRESAELDAWQCLTHSRSQLPVLTVSFLVGRVTLLKWTTEKNRVLLF